MDAAAAEAGAQLQAPHVADHRRGVKCLLTNRQRTDADFFFSPSFQNKPEKDELLVSPSIQKVFLGSQNGAAESPDSCPPKCHMRVVAASLDRFDGPPQTEWESFVLNRQVRITESERRQSKLHTFI